MTPQVHARVTALCKRPNLDGTCMPFDFHGVSQHGGGASRSVIRARRRRRRPRHG